MRNTNGQGRKNAVLYARVSTDEQARSGYSLAQQIEALRATPPLRVTRSSKWSWTRGRAGLPWRGPAWTG